MRTLWTTAGILTLAAATAACNPAPLGHGANRHDRAVQVSDRLDCPSSQGDLNRVEQAADGKSCRYAGDDGQEVTLSYLDLKGGTPQAALAPIEADFRTAVPEGATPAEASTTNADGAHASWSDSTSNTTTSAGAKTTSTTTVTHERDDEDGDDSGRRRHNDHVHLILPGMSIDADNGRARIRAFGQTIDADDSHGGRAVVKGSWNGMQSDINAHDHGAEMRFGWIGKRSVDMTYIVAGKTPGPTGLRAAAYAARGPVSGPLVIAVGKSKRGGDDENGDGEEARGAVHDLKRLVDRNVHRM